ncbi:U1 small nuclear ribonucleoprotein 70 kDa [Takifugu rubripes]|uniref:U1 small nuclear ribonucleoprotein 70 kDa n=1 Tax=Takifugu rubripes TaxID=31033 RepID=H2TEQ8_TAKRU|nr:U1 small nuclear ribonucleoprotein 70 kDa [Takifugu rubripes]|eukprot:XP_003966415.1 PREDICTED: U1 small nuclear ribonucleoprotein 70 kDa [Takifugu rubripes]
MTQFLPPNLLALFAPRDPIPFLPQLVKLPHEKHHNQPYSGIAPFIRHFEDPRDAPPPTRAETRDERLERKRREKIERRQTVLETELKLWDPHNDPNAQGDAFKTLFVARVNYDTTESKLRREFEVYGPIKRIYIVYSKRTAKPRGYAFIEYEHERDMHSAYKHADGKKIDGRRVLVDVERGRTVKGWRPRRLGGGLGGTRRGGADVNIKHSGRDDASRYDDRAIGGERDRGERRERSRERDRDKDRERRRTRSRERRRRSRSRERERDRGERHVRDESTGNTRRRERERDRGVAAGEDSRSRERSRERKKRSRSKDRKRERERGKGAEGEEVVEGDGSLEGGERVLAEREGEPGEGMEERRDRERDRDRDRRRSHRDRERRRGDRDRDHKRERDRDRSDRKEEHHSSLQDDMGTQEDMGNDHEAGAPPHVEEYSQDGLMSEQQSVPLTDGYGSSENGYKIEASGDEY